MLASSPCELEIGALEAQGAVVAEQQPAHLELRHRPDREDGARAGRPVAIAGRNGRGDALVAGCRLKSVAALELARQRRETAAQARGQAGRDALRIAAAVKGVARYRGQIAPSGADQLDRSRHRARPERARPAAARHADARQAIGGQRAEGNIAEEGVGDRHPVEQYQCAARGIAAQRAQGGALGRRIGRPAVRPSELLEARDVVQHILDTARCIVVQPLAVDHHRSISRRSGRKIQARTENDDVPVAIACRCGLAVRGERPRRRCEKDQAHRSAGHRIASLDEVAAGAVNSPRPLRKPGTAVQVLGRGAQRPGSSFPAPRRIPARLPGVQTGAVMREVAGVLKPAPRPWLVRPLRSLPPVEPGRRAC